MQILKNVHQIPGVIANAYLLVDPDGLTLIDTGLPRSERKILAFMARLGYAPGDLKRILITHADVDHFGSLAALAAATAASTYASAIEAEAIAAGRSSREIAPAGSSLRSLLFSLLRPFMKAQPFQVEQVVGDGAILPVLGGLRAVDSSGHTPGHLSWYAPAAGVLFCGDSMVSDTAGLHGSRPGLTADQGKAQEAVKRQAALGARIVCPGHGPVIRDAAGKFPTPS
jgi:glyoxylase-like metal-dependent hydrolase (beta-lactamase superfamily II)